jgi:hypothetical protein
MAFFESISPRLARRSNEASELPGAWANRKSFRARSPVLGSCASEDAPGTACPKTPLLAQSQATDSVCLEFPAPDTHKEVIVGKPFAFGFTTQRSAVKANGPFSRQTESPLGNCSILRASESRIYRGYCRNSQRRPQEVESVEEVEIVETVKIGEGYKKGVQQLFAWARPFASMPNFLIRDGTV